MWNIQEIEEMNPQVYRHLNKLGGICETLICQAASHIETADPPHVACFFQLPYAVLLENKWHEATVKESGVKASFKAHVYGLAIEDSLTLRLHPLVLNDTSSTDLPLLTQFVAIIPLWGSRLRFYGRYADCVHDEGLHDRIIVPPEDNWIFTERLVAMRASVFEANMARKLYGEMAVMLRRILPAYSALTRIEAPQPPILYNYFAMPFPGRLILHRPPKPTVSAMLKRRSPLPKNWLRAERLKNASAGIRREVSDFEQQLYAMNRLRQEGEPALALIGCLSLIEWYVDRQIVQPALNIGKQISIVKVLKETSYLDFIDQKLRSALLQAAAIRNGLVHGSPPPRKSLTDGLATDAGSEHAPLGASHSAEAERTVDAAFRLFKAINEEKRRRP